MRLEYFTIESDAVLDTVVLDEPPASETEPIIYDTRVAEPIVSAIMSDVNLTEMAKRRQLAVWSDGTNAMRRV